MAKSNAAVEIKKLIDKLTAERREAVEKIAEIDAVFASLGMGEPVAARRGRKPAAATPAGKPGRKPGRKAGGAKSAGRRRRGSFAVSGEESILAFVAKAGTPSTREVNEHWTAEGRAGKADNALGKLVKQGKLQRIEQKGERGSRYQAA